MEILLTSPTREGTEPFRFLCCNWPPGISRLSIAARCTSDFLHWLEAELRCSKEVRSRGIENMLNVPGVKKCTKLQWMNVWYRLGRCRWFKAFLHITDCYQHWSFLAQIYKIFSVGAVYFCILFYITCCPNLLETNLTAANSSEPATVGRPYWPASGPFGLDGCQLW